MILQEVRKGQWINKRWDYVVSGKAVAVKSWMRLNRRKVVLNYDILHLLGKSV